MAKIPQKNEAGRDCRSKPWQGCKATHARSSQRLKGLFFLSRPGQHACKLAQYHFVWAPADGRPHSCFYMSLAEAAALINGSIARLWGFAVLIRLGAGDNLTLRYHFSKYVE